MSKKELKILITGGAGFIGSHLINRFKGVFDSIIIADKELGIPEDGLHYQRFLKVKENNTVYECDIRDFNQVNKLLNTHKPDIIIHLAAKTGITESSVNPQLYYETNVTGFYNVLENARLIGIKNIIYASSSSVYSPDEKCIFYEDSNTDNQASFYGKTKKINEEMAIAYSKFYNINCIGLRFFTVYGSWVREDMAGFKFMKSLFEKTMISLYNNGEVSRDFTHVDDITEAIYKICNKISEKNYAGLNMIFNIGNGNPKTVKSYLNEIEMNLKLEAKIDFKQLPSIELQHTHASTGKLENWIDFKPRIDFKAGIKEMCYWYMDFKNK